MGEVYQRPNYYEIAFAYRDFGAEVALFEEIIQRYSQIPVTRVLEIGCGSAPHLSELTHRGYAYVGLDLSSAMLDDARIKVQASGANATFMVADMSQFQLDEAVDFTFILLGSLYVGNTASLVSHFDFGESRAEAGRTILSGLVY